MGTFIFWAAVVSVGVALSGAILSFLWLVLVSAVMVVTWAALITVNALQRAYAWLVGSTR